MLTIVSIVTFFTALTSSACALSDSSLLLHEKRDTQPASFVNQGSASPDTPLPLRIALAQKDIAGLKDKLIDISTPGKAAYGQHLSKEEVFAYTAPTPAAVDAINKWLAENDLTSFQHSPAGDWISITPTVRQANALFDANFANFVNTETGDTAIRTLAYSLPAYLKDHVELVHPTISFPGSRSNIAFESFPQSSQQGGAPASCDSAITPTCLQQRYHIPTTAATQKSNRIAVTGLDGISASETDLKEFLTSYRPDVSSSTTFTLQTLDGGSQQQNITVINNEQSEANLDIQYTVGLATGVPVVFVSVGDDNQVAVGDAYLDIVNYLAGDDSPPTVWTTSYGLVESMLSPAFADRICNAYAALGARGTSVLFASGDGGITGLHNETCSTFVATFPSGCPYVTSVGATQNVDPEVAASFSSGGFSNYFAAPSYQTNATTRYLSAIGPVANAGLYNTSGRGYPDVALIGNHVEIIANGTVKSVFGTSCSSPIFASIIALLNDELIAAGKSPLGFLNPWLYSTAVLNDITTGSNPGCNTNGFYTMSGWDPVTGLGSPDYVNLRAAAGLS